jgi:hypothetical protein
MYCFYLEFEFGVNYVSYGKENEKERSLLVFSYPSNDKWMNKDE